MNGEVKFFVKIKIKIGGGGGGRGVCQVGRGGEVVRVDVNEELKFCENSKKKIFFFGGGGVRGGGVNKELKFL